MNENKFTGKAELYSKYRPSYPEKLIDWLYDMTNAEAVADIGAGTGIFTSALLKKPWSVTAVEPNSDMLSILKKALGDKVKTVIASAESTTLNAKSINLITVAQAFHWFDKARFKAECRRILTHDGHLAIVWNSRCQNSLEEERNKICMKYCDCYRSGHVKTGYDDFDGDSFLRNEYFKNTDFLRLEMRDLSQRNSLSATIFPVRMRRGVMTAAMTALFVSLKMLFQNMKKAARFHKIILPSVISVHFNKF